MNHPSSSLSQTSKSQTTKPLNSSSYEFKTSNSVIFPSLSPLGPLYKQRKPTRPNPAYKAHSEAAELQKKQKLNNGFEKIQTSQEIVNLPEKKFESPVRIGTTFDKFDKDGFQIPKLPKRLNTEKPAESNIQIPEVINKPPTQYESFAKDIFVPIVKTDPREQGLQDLKESLAEFVLEKQLENRVSEFSPPKDSDFLNPNNLGFIKFDLVDLNALFERLNYEYYTLILKQNLEQIAQSQLDFIQQMGNGKPSKIEESTAHKTIKQESIFQRVAVTPNNNGFENTKVEHVSS